MECSDSWNEQKTSAAFWGYAVCVQRILEKI